MFTVTGYLFLGFVIVVVYELYLLDRGFSSFYKRNSVEILVNFRELEYFRNLLSSSFKGRDFRFSNGLWYIDVLRVLEWISKNWNPLKDTRRLPRVDPSGRSVTGLYPYILMQYSILLLYFNFIIILLISSFFRQK